MKSFCQETFNYTHKKEYTHQLALNYGEALPVRRGDDVHS